MDVKMLWLIGAGLTLAWLMLLVFLDLRQLFFSKEAMSAWTVGDLKDDLLSIAMTTLVATCLNVLLSAVWPIYWLWRLHDIYKGDE